MNAKQLTPRIVHKPWGRRDLPAWLAPVPGRDDPVGEIWFEDPGGSARPLLVKYLFTSEKLSIQVHPDDQRARADGHSSGKDEAWVVLSADPDAVIGIGLREPVSRDELRAGALDGRIVDMVDWRAAAAGHSYYSPAGTVHALGQGLTVIEVQQNVDLTYRLYDYGRPRELHLDKGIEAAIPAPYVAAARPRDLGAGRKVVAEGSAFVVERWSGGVSGHLRPNGCEGLWLIPVDGDIRLDSHSMPAGSAWILEGEAALAMADGADLLVAYPGPHSRQDILSRS